MRYSEGVRQSVSLSMAISESVSEIESVSVISNAWFLTFDPVQDVLFIDTEQLINFRSSRPHSGRALLVLVLYLNM